MFIGRDNLIALSLINDNVPIIHNSISRCQISFNSTLIDSNIYPLFFDFTNADRLILKFGAAGLTAGRYESTVIIYDALHQNGLVWGKIMLVVI